MPTLIDCAGAPRDLGLDQGVACAGAVRARIAECGIRSRRRFLPRVRRLAGGAALGAGAGREVLRHCPHLAERMSGLARGAGVALDALMELLVTSAYGSLPDPLAATAVGCSARRGGEPVLVRPLAAGAPWIVRRSRPEVGFASVEVAPPWAASALAGVNEQGIAVLAAPVEAPLRARGLGAPPAGLLVQECLQRFASVDGAVEWCLERPAAGSLSLLLADARGAAAAVELTGSERRLVRGEAHLVAGGTVRSESSLRKALEDGAALTPALLDAWCAEGGGAAQVWLEPRTRSLGWYGAGEGRLGPGLRVSAAGG